MLISFCVIVNSVYDSFFGVFFFFFFFNICVCHLLFLLIKRYRFRNTVGVVAACRDSLYKYVY